MGRRSTPCASPAFLRLTRSPYACVSRVAIVLSSNESGVPAGSLGRSPRACLDVYGPRPIATGLAKAGPKVTTADVYPASLCGLSDHRREPRWIFARFHLNGAKALAEAMPVQTPGSQGTTMEYATLGNTGLLVSKLCFGTMTF